MVGGCEQGLSSPHKLKGVAAGRQWEQRRVLREAYCLFAFLACVSGKSLTKRCAYVWLFLVSVIFEPFLTLYTHRLYRAWLWGVRDKVCEES